MGFRIAAVVGVWLCASTGGLLALMQQKSEPGAVGAVPESWPLGSALALATDRPTIVFSAHPRCVCTRASVAELARLVSRVDANARIHVLFVRPPDVDDAWMRSDTWRDASLIPGADVREDRGGVESERFGAKTSGSVAVFAPDGRRLFSGGLTASRGHEGDNAGLARAIAAVRGGERVDSSNVYGCGLEDPEGGT